MRRRSLVLLTCAAVVAGCGRERTEVPEFVAVAEPAGALAAEYPQAGVTFTAPANWILKEAERPQVFTLRSGGAFVTGFAYRRSEDLPGSAEELAEAERLLIAEVEERDPGFDLRSSETGEVDGAPSIELRGTQTIAERRLETRSVHVYKGEVEYVFEALAPEDGFALASGGVLRRLLATAGLRGTLRRQSRADED